MYIYTYRYIHIYIHTHTHTHAHIGDLVEFYKKAKVRFDEDEEFASRSRKEVLVCP